MESVRLSLSISLAILPSDALSSSISNECSSLATVHTAWNTIPQSMLLLLQWYNYSEYITSTVGIDVVMEGCGHNDKLITRQIGY